VALSLPEDARREDHMIADRDSEVGVRASRARAPVFQFVVVSGLIASLSAISGPIVADEVEAVTSIYMGGPIFTADQESPRAEALAVRNGEIVYVGRKAGALTLEGPKRVFDLKGAMVIPGLVDAHTHPGLVAILGSGDPAVDAAQALKYSSKAEFFAALREVAKTSPGKGPLMLGPWDVVMFLPDGPNKRDIDPIFPDRPVVIQDNSGHSLWANSVALKILGINRNTPDLSPNISVIVRDGMGEPTGWLKEFVALNRIMPVLVPDDAILRSRLQEFIGFLVSRGVTTVYDAGNFAADERVYKVLAQLDRTGKLSVRYYGSYHIWAPNLIDGAVDKLLQLRANYSSKHLHFDTIKIHYDGVTEIGTAGVLEGYAFDLRNRGGILFDKTRLSRFLEELDSKHVDLHLHTVGDRATRTALDAVEEAQRRLGRKLSIQVTLAHLELVDPADYKRFAALGVHANFTPHWFGGLEFGRASFANLGAPRANRNQMIGTLLRNGANVTLSSDVIASGEMRFADPFLGIEMAMTRKPVSGPIDPDRKPLPQETLSLEQALTAYTIAGARQLGSAARTGSLQKGKAADFVILHEDLFKQQTQSIHSSKVEAVFVGGRLVSGNEPR
jgi:predicted amidohydrolase YtcJ